jgi:fatty-acid desaturase
MSAADPSLLETHAAWTLVAAYGVSLLYEVWRATAKAGTSRHDSPRTFFTQDLLLYVMATVVIWLLFAGVAAAAWIGLVFSVVWILVSILYYNPRVMIDRKPGVIDWAEDLVYTGLLFVAAVLLLYELVGRTLV